jgi:hypothetical protein
MHYLSLVFGPTSYDELTIMLQSYGEDSPLVHKECPVPDGFNDSIQLRVIHDYICSITPSKKPFYLVMDADNLPTLERNTFLELEYDGVLVYNDVGNLRFLTQTAQSVWDWYVVGGRWHNHLQCKPGAVSDLIERDIAILAGEDALGIHHRLEALMKKYELQSEEKIGHNALRLKNIDWERMGEERWVIMEPQWEIANKVAPNADSIFKIMDVVLEELKEKSFSAWRVSSAAYSRFYAQWKKEDVTASKPDAEFCFWGALNVVGLSKEEAKERCFLRVYSPSYLFINGELIEDDADLRSIDNMLAIKEKVLSQDPETIVIVVDIHN